MIDEEIGAYLDDELDPQQRGASLRQLTSEPSAADRLGLFTRADNQLRRAFAIGPVAQDDPLAVVLRSSQSMRGSGAVSFWRRVGALAAACVLGVLAGVGLGRNAMPTDIGNLGPAIIDALQSAPSGQTRMYRGREIVLAQTIRTDRGYCREARVTDAGGATDILACRQGDSWMLVASVMSVSDGSDEYAAAGVQPSPLDVALNRFGSATYVEAAEEGQLIAARWRDEPGR